MHIDEELRKRGREILRLAMAEKAFLEARALARHVVASGLTPACVDTERRDLYDACVHGIVISYCRPFMEATGLGPLGRRYSSFEDSPKPTAFAQLHQNVLDTRNKLTAHMDIKSGLERFQSGASVLNPGEVALHLRPDGFDLRTNQTQVDLQVLIDLDVFLNFQLSRLAQDQTKFAIGVLKETNAQLGFYVFGTA